MPAPSEAASECTVKSCSSWVDAGKQDAPGSGQGRPLTFAERLRKSTAGCVTMKPAAPGIRNLPSYTRTLRKIDENAEGQRNVPDDSDDDFGPESRDCRAR